jgi:uncharacterized protein (DUF58 family)
VLTRRGAVVVAGGLGMAVAGRLLGITELFAFATAMLLLVAGAYVYVRFARYSLSATRQLRPPRVHAGGASRVELTLTNTGRRRSPVLTLRDPFDKGRRWARFPLAPLSPSESARAAYRLPTESRGIFSLGPLEVVITDPFGLAAAGRRAAGSTTLTVFPRVDPIAPIPGTTGPDPSGTSAQLNALTLSGEEFYALREYEVGDDLRRVHWPSTAKLDEIMIRQDELPWQGRATVLVDLRRQVHTTDTFEAALSAAASILNVAAKGNALVRLLTTDGYDSDFGWGHVHIDNIFERLAGAGPHATSADFTGALSLLRRGTGGGSLAVVTAAAAPAADLQAITRVRSRYGATVVVVIGDDRSTEGGPARAGAIPGLGSVVRAGTDGSFAMAWNQAMTRSGAGRSARGRSVAHGRN